jgi:hypothetical protein
MQKAGGSGLVGATYALKGDGALYGAWAANQILASGDTVTIRFANNQASGGTSRMLIDNDIVDATRVNIQHATTDEKLYYSTTFGSFTLDAVSIASGAAAYPTDGLIHEIVGTMNAAGTLKHVLSNWNLAQTSLTAIISIVITTAARGTEGWFFNGASTTVVAETLLGTGSDINLIGVAAEDFVTVPL